MPVTVSLWVNSPYVWDEQCEVRPELGDAHRQRSTDVFSDLQVCRVNTSL